MKKAKVIAIIVVSILILIIFWQNKGNVEARLLLATTNKGKSAEFLKFGFFFFRPRTGYF